MLWRHLWPGLLGSTCHPMLGKPTQDGQGRGPWTFFVVDQLRAPEPAVRGRLHRDLTSFTVWVRAGHALPGGLDLGAVLLGSEPHAPSEPLPALLFLEALLGPQKTPL